MKDLIRAVREKSRKSPAAFAGAIEASERAVQNWERGDNRPHPKYLKRMAELVPALWAEVERELAEYKWHLGARGKRKRRYNEERIMQAHTALDLILDRARSDIVERVLTDLDKFAGRFADSKD